MIVIEFTTPVIVLVLFALIPVISAKPKWDSLTYVIIATLACVLITSAVYPSSDFLGYVRFEPLIYIIAMSVIVEIMEKNSVFQFLAVETIRLTKSSPRLFFIMTCIVALLTSAVLEDVSVVYLFMPIVIKACRMLKLDPKPYIYGIAVSLNAGNLFMPFSNSQNIIIAGAFSIGAPWFAEFLDVPMLLSVLIVIVWIDHFDVRKQQPPTKEYTDILMDVLPAALVIANRKKFNLALISFGCVVVALIVIPETYIVAAIGAVAMCLVEREPLSNLLKKVDYNLVFLFIGLFLITGCMSINGTTGLIGNGVVAIATSNEFVASIVVLLITSAVATALSPTPATVLFVPILQHLFSAIPSIGATLASRTPILVGFMLGLVIGGNFLIQGAPSYMVTLPVCAANGVPEVTYKSMTMVGIKFSILHIIMSIGYLALICLALGFL
jgi:Na+/H+ antiporter NhaD/arsenite permease-like protein